VIELGVNWNLLLAATVTVIVAAEAVPAARRVVVSNIWNLKRYEFGARRNWRKEIEDTRNDVPTWALFIRRFP
jgi:hypothetical protein